MLWKPHQDASTVNLCGIIEMTGRVYENSLAAGNGQLPWWESFLFEEDGTVIEGRFVMLAQGQRWRRKLEELEVGLRARVLFALLERVGYGNVVHCTGAGLARVLGTSPMVVNRHLAWYAKEGIIERVRDGQGSCIVLNEQMFWKGDRVARVIGRRRRGRRET